MIRSSFIVPYLLLLLVGCSGNKEESADREPPLVVLDSPTDQQVFTGSQLIFISGRVTDNRYIREIHIEISNLQTGQELQHIHIHPASATYAFSHSFQILSGNQYLIRIIGDDASSNSTVVRAEISCN